MIFVLSLLWLFLRFIVGFSQEAFSLFSSCSYILFFFLTKSSDCHWEGCIEFIREVISIHLGCVDGF